MLRLLFGIDAIQSDFYLGIYSHTATHQIRLFWFLLIFRLIYLIRNKNCNTQEKGIVYPWRFPLFKTAK